MVAMLAYILINSSNKQYSVKMIAFKGEEDRRKRENKENETTNQTAKYVVRA